MCTNQVAKAYFFQWPIDFVAIFVWLAERGGLSTAEARKTNRIKFICSRSGFLGRRCYTEVLPREYSAYAGPDQAKRRQIKILVAP